MQHSHAPQNGMAYIIARSADLTFADIYAKQIVRIRCDR